VAQEYTKTRCALSLQMTVLKAAMSVFWWCLVFRIGNKTLCLIALSGCLG
jgi:hypothetical protein